MELGLLFNHSHPKIVTIVVWVLVGLDELCVNSINGSIIHWKQISKSVKNLIKSIY